MRTASIIGLFLVCLATMNTPATAQKVIVEQPINQTPMAEQTAFYERKQFEITENNGKRITTYFWLAPQPPYPEGIKFPLVLILHGSTGLAHAGRYLVMPDMQVKYPAFILVPMAAAGKIWSYPDSLPPDGANLAPYTQLPHALPDAVAIIRRVMEEYPVDPARIYVTGCSGGGFGAFGAVRDYPDIFAAAMPMSGGWNPEDAPRMTKVPLAVFHGRLDKNVPASLSRDTADLIRQYGGKVYYTEYADMDHQCPHPRLYGDKMWEWLFSQKKP